MILVSVRTIRLNPPICSAWMDCTRPEHRPLGMLKVPRDISQGRGGHRRGGFRDVLRRSPTWMIGRVRQMGILVGSLENISHISLYSFYVRYTSISLRRYPPHLSNGRGHSLLNFIKLTDNGWGGGGLAPPACTSTRINL